MGYSVVNIEDIEGAGPTGAVRFVRRIDGEEIEVKRGTVLRFDPETTRCPIAGPDGMTFVAIGARRGSYEARGPF